MSSRKETERIKYIQEKCQTLLNQMLRDEDNKYCVDCDAKGPRWASWNLGIFLCIRCAGIHRNLGVHISRVKSVNLDSWTPEQVVSLQQMGNSRARAVYEAQLPDGFKRPQTDHTLESFIRAKYEHKRYLAKEWVPPSAPKVNWDKEIDDEIERQKRKKKTSTNSTSLSIASPISNDNKKSTSNINKTPIPAPLPKPKANTNSPKTTLRTEQISAPATVTLDLLGLSTPTTTVPLPGNGINENNFNDLNSDTFSNFLSGPAAPQTTESVLKMATSATGCKPYTSNLELLNETNDNSLAKEEADFFNQIPNEKEKAKMTKDSILALYGNAPTNSLGGGFTTFNSPAGPLQSGLVGGHTFNAQFGQTNMGNTGNILGQTGSTIPQQYVVSQPNILNGGLLGGYNIIGQSQPPQQHLPQIQSLLNQSSTTIMANASCPFSGIGNQQLQTTGPQINGTFAHFPPQTNNFAQSVQQTTNPTSNANINQQFNNLNLGNVWQ